MKKVTRYEPFTHIKVNGEFLRVNSKTARAKNDGKGWITYHTDAGEFTDKDHKGFYVTA